jgi:hypothetical protein
VEDPTLEEIVVWSRYLTWCEDHYRRFDDLMAKDSTHEGAADYAWFFARIAHWYASLWVVVEGWRELGLRDNIIDGLLRNGHALCDLFRQFHNSVYHYRRDFFDSGIVAPLNEGEAAIPWAHALRSEFRRFLWEWPSRSGTSREEAAVLRAHLRDILGWFPDDCLVAQVASLEHVAEQAELLYRTMGDSPHAAELRSAAEEARQSAHETRKRYLARQQEYFSKRWLEKADLKG